MKDELNRDELMSMEPDEEMDDPFADEWMCEVTDYLGQPVSVPESLVGAFLKQQEELKAKYGDKMSPEMEAAMARRYDERLKALCRNAFRRFCVLSARRAIHCVRLILSSRFRVWVTVWVKPRAGTEMPAL